MWKSYFLYEPGLVRGYGVPQACAVHRSVPSTKEEPQIAASPWKPAFGRVPSVFWREAPKPISISVIPLLLPVVCHCRKCAEKSPTTPSPKQSISPKHRTRRTRRTRPLGIRPALPRIRGDLHQGVGHPRPTAVSGAPRTGVQAGGLLGGRKKERKRIGGDKFFHEKTRTQVV